MFFDFHYSSFYFISKNYSKSFHLLDPTVYETSYPAVQHPIILKIFNFFNCFNNKFFWTIFCNKFFIIYLFYGLIIQCF